MAGDSAVRHNLGGSGYLGTEWWKPELRLGIPVHMVRPPPPPGITAPNVRSAEDETAWLRERAGPAVLGSKSRPCRWCLPVLGQFTSPSGPQFPPPKRNKETFHLFGPQAVCAMVPCPSPAPCRTGLGTQQTFVIGLPGPWPQLQLGPGLGLRRGNRNEGAGSRSRAQFPGLTAASSRRVGGGWRGCPAGPAAPPAGGQEAPPRGS